MVTDIHYMNFEVVEAFQVGDSTWKERDEQFGWVPADHPAYNPPPEKWIVKLPNGKIIVEDSELAKVISWLWGQGLSKENVYQEAGESSARSFAAEEPKTFVFCKPVLSNGWTGNWQDAQAQ